MDLPEDTHLAYVVRHEAWYWPGTRNVAGHDQPSLSVMASAKGTGGGCAWEFMIAEHPIGRGQPPLHVALFDDAFGAFTQVPELFAALAEQGERATLDSVRAVLDGLGAVDETARIHPASLASDVVPAPAATTQE